RRLAEAGLPQDLFSDEALAEVARRSRGAPRLINLLCSNALFRAECDQAPQASADHVRGAAEALQLPSPPPPVEPPQPAPLARPATVIGVAGVAMGDAPPRPRMSWRALAGGVTLFLGGLVGLGLLMAAAAPPPATAPAQAAMPPAAPTPTSAPEPAPPVIAVHY